MLQEPGDAKGRSVLRVINLHGEHMVSRMGLPD